MLVLPRLLPLLLALLAMAHFNPATPAVAAPPGALVIAGGAIKDENAALFRALLDRRPAGAPGIAIIAAASAEPATALARTRDLLVRHGADPADIRLVQLATLDDPATPEDEARWANNADSLVEMEKLQDAGAIWFTGGDQSRILALLVGPDGREQPMLALIRARHKAGAVMGGTSAGAAIMSNPMLTGGDPVAIVAGPSHSGEALGMAPGLGFLASGIVDQHFDVRYRLPRLLEALMHQPAPARIGFGIAEDTALVVEQRHLSAVGAGLVTIVDARRARRPDGPGLGASGVSIRFLANGQSLPLP